MEVIYSDDKHNAKVKSDSTDTWYDVSRTSCNCPHFKFRLRGTGVCKHMTEAFYKQQDEVEQSIDTHDTQTTVNRLDVFNNGIDIDDAYELFTDDEIQRLIDNQTIIKHKRQFILLR